MFHYFCSNFVQACMYRLVYFLLLPEVGPRLFLNYRAFRENGRLEKLITSVLLFRFTIPIAQFQK